MLYAFADDVEDCRCGDGFDAGLVFDGDDALRLALSDDAVLRVDALIEGVALALEPVFIGALGLLGAVVAAAGAGEAAGERRKQQDRQVGLEVVADGGVHGEDAVGAKSTPRALVGLRGVGVTVAEDDGAASQGREDDLAERLAAVGEHEGHFSFGGDAAELGLAARVEDDGADAVAERRSAGLAERDDAAAVGSKRGGEAAQLRSFAGAVEAFEGDEEARLHRPQSISRAGEARGIV